MCKYNKDIIVPNILQDVNITNLDDALNESDFIVITCALNKFTKHLINKENILKSKKGVKIINVARGPVVKEDDVIELLENEFISALGSDVFEIEPLPADSKLRNFHQNFPVCDQSAKSIFFSFQ